LKKEATAEELKSAGFQTSDVLQPAAAVCQGGLIRSGADVDLPEDDEDMDGWETSEDAKAIFKRLGMQPVTSVDTKALYAQPPPAAAGTLEQAVSKALAGETSEAIAAQQRVVYNLSAAMDAARPFGVQDELYLMAKKRMEVAKDQLKALTDKAPKAGSQSAVERLKQARQCWVVTVTNATEGRAKGKEKAVAKNKADLDTIDQQISRLQLLRQAVVKVFSETEQAFAKAQNVREELNKSIADGIDSRIALVTPIGGEVADELGAAEPGESAVVAPSTARYSELMLSADSITPEDVPAVDVEAATEEQKAVLEAIWAYLVTLNGAPTGMPTPPTTFMQMGAGHVHIAQTLVGTTVWRAFYGATRVVQPNDYVPWQLLSLLQHAMEKAKTKITISKQVAEAASSAHLEAMSSAKDNCYCPF
jgi:hypothetical protein